MNTQLAFAFGMLAMVAITMVVVLVVGMVKVIKLEKQHKELDRASSREIEFVHKHISDNERNLYSELNEVRRMFDEHTDNLRRELQAYTDSRIDKTLGTTKKQILKD
jgi:CHASE1-domain containing sensor protein